MPIFQIRKLRLRQTNAPKVTQFASGRGETNSEDGVLCRRPAHAPAWEDSSPGSHQPQEGSTQDHGDEPAQRASGLAAPPGASHHHRLILRRGVGPEEPLPGSRGPGPTEFQLQLQFGGSGEAVLLPPGFSAKPRELGAEPRPRPSRPGRPCWSHFPRNCRCSGRGSRTSEHAWCCRPVTRALQPARCLRGSRGGNVAPRQPRRLSNRKLIWLPGRPDVAPGPPHHTQLNPQRPRERAPRGGVELKLQPGTRRIVR